MLRYPPGRRVAPALLVRCEFHLGIYTGHDPIILQRFRDQGNPDLIKNLDFARSRRLDQVPVKTEKRVLPTLFFRHYDFGVKTRFLLGGCFWALGFLAVSFWIWLRRRRFALGLAAITLPPAWCFAASVGWEDYQAHTNLQGVIVADAVASRQGDGENYPPSFKGPLHSGTEFDLLEKRTDWLRIELANGNQSWIPTPDAETI